MVETVNELREYVMTLLSEREFENAQHLIEDVLERARNEKNEALKAEALRCKAQLILHQLMMSDAISDENDSQKKLAQALECLDESGNLARYYGDVAQQSWVRLTLAQLREYQLEFTRVSHLLEDALQRSRRGDDKYMILETIWHVAKIFDNHGLLGLKESLIDEALMLAQTLEKKEYLSWFLIYKTKIELLKGNLDNARSLMEESREFLESALHREEIEAISERLKGEDAYLRAQIGKMKATLETMKEKNEMLLLDLKVVEQVFDGSLASADELFDLAERFVTSWRFNQYLARAIYHRGLHALQHGDVEVGQRVLTILSRRMRMQKGMTEFYHYLYESLAGLRAFIQKDVEKSLDHFMAASRGLDVLSTDLQLSNDVLLALARVLNWIANLDAESLDDAKSVISAVIEEAKNKGFILHHAKGLLGASIIHLIAGEFAESRAYLESVQQLVSRHGLTFIQNKSILVEETLGKFDEEVPSEERSAILDELMKVLDF